jgi:hypothetical protein
MVGHLVRAYGRIPYSDSAEFFNRDPSTLSRDIRRFESSLASSRELRAKISRLADEL